MDITKVNAFGHNYVTTDLLAFGDYDNSSDIERANALFALRTAANAWNGEILYTNEHTIEESLDDPSLVLRTGCDPKTKDWRKHVEWPYSTPPKAIHHLTAPGSFEQVYVREDIAQAIGLLDALQEYPLLDDDTNSEVEAIIQDASWASYIYQELQPHLPNHIDEQHAKAAFWEALKLIGHYGHIENTTWTGFDIQTLLPNILKKLKEAEAGTQHAQHAKEDTKADTRH